MSGTTRSLARTNRSGRLGAGALQQIQADTEHRPLLLAGARVLTGDPVIGDFPAADVLLGGSVIVGVGPALLSAAGDDGAIVVDCTGMTLIPAVVDALTLLGFRRSRRHRLGTLTPGSAADLVVLAGDEIPSLARGAEVLVRHPDRVAALLREGEVLRWDGADILGPAGAPPADPTSRTLTDGSRVGVWVDDTGFLHQELTPDGRYDETRGGRLHAFQGAYRCDGDRIDYLDDLGFWAFGEFRGDELHHAGYVMRRR